MSARRPTLLVLAAGIGSRYGGLKQIDPVGPSGEIIIDYSIYDAIRAGFGRIVFVIRKDIEKDFRECVGQRFEPRIRTEYVFQELGTLPHGFNAPSARQKPWGTGHAILAARDAVKEPFAAINADDFYGRRGYELLAKALSQKPKNKIPEYYMIGFRLGNTLSDFGHVARGVCKAAPDKSLLEIVERTQIERTDFGAKFADENGSVVNLSGDETVSMNMWGFDPSIFPHIEEQFREFLQTKIQDPKAELFIPTVVGNLINNKKATVKVLPSNDRWFGVTYREDKPIVAENIRKLINAGAYPINCL